MKIENDSLREQLGDMELQIEQAKIRQVDQTAAEFLAFHDESLARLRLESSRQLEAQVVDYRCVKKLVHVHHFILLLFLNLFLPIHVHRALGPVWTLNTYIH